MALILAALLAWLALCAGLLFAWRGALRALWREPVLRAPILLLESDDWGAGPLEQAAALDAIAACLTRRRDAKDRPAVMTLALILALAKPGSPQARITLADAEYQSVLEAIQRGCAQGVFALQLHGMEHYWPPSVQQAAASHASVADWLKAPLLTENLPSPLQSRWTDAAVLPSRSHAPEAVEQAVAAETRLYATLFGAPPEVVVPPTFIWNERVEAAWADAGVRVVITPGRRLTGRDATGAPAFPDRPMLNGDVGAGGVLYLVRDEYFEPKYGHTPEQALAALQRKTALGRPCLLETHRWNFLAATGGDLAAALAALDTLYRQALKAHSNLRFASCAELAEAIRSQDPAWIESDLRRRFTIWTRRAALLPRFGKLARLSGLLPLLQLFLRPRP